MATKIILLSCALLALFIANMPTVKAISCDEDPSAGCTDCSLPENYNVPDCAIFTTTVSYEAETTTERRPNGGHNGGNHGGHKGGRRGRWGRRGSRPTFNFFF